MAEPFDWIPIGTWYTPGVEDATTWVEVFTGVMLSPASCIVRDMTSVEVIELVTVTSSVLEVDPPLVRVTLGVVPVTVTAAPLLWHVKGFEPPKHPQQANSMRKKAIFPLGLDFVGIA